MNYSSNNKNLIHISYSSDVNSASTFFNETFNTSTIYSTRLKNKTYVIINKDYYKTNPTHCTEKINRIMLKNQANTIVLNSFDFLESVNYVLNNTSSPQTIYFTKNCKVNFEQLLNTCKMDKISKLIFDKNLSIDEANSLLKLNIPFETTKNFKLLNLSKFSGSNDMFTLSDYFSLNKLEVKNNLTQKELKDLNHLFSFNKSLYEITLHCNLKTAYQIVKSYLNNNSRFSYSKFKINIDNFVLNATDSTYLYEINKMLTKNNCSLGLVFDKETISYKNYHETISPLKKYANKLNGFNLSPLEKLILIEDYTKSKPYNDSENKNTSRNLFSSLNSDYIVCFVYSNTFKILCDMCNIPATVAKCRLTFTSGKTSEHSKVICNILDEKYNYKGICIFDPSNDSIDKDSIFDEEKPCDNYLFFATPFSSNNLCSISSCEEFGLLKIAQDNKYDYRCIEQINECCKQINELNGTNLRPYKNDSLSASFEIALNRTLSKIQDCKPLSIATFKECLTTARNKIEEFSNEDMERILTINAYKSISQFTFNDNTFSELTNSLIDSKFDEEIISFDDFE